MRKPVAPTVVTYPRCKSSDFTINELPRPGEKVEVLGTVGGANHLIPFVCSWTEEGWVVAGTRRLLAFNVVGWRRTGP